MWCELLNAEWDRIWIVCVLITVYRCHVPHRPLRAESSSGTLSVWSLPIAPAERHSERPMAVVSRSAPRCPRFSTAPGSVNAVMTTDIDTLLLRGAKLACVDPSCQTVSMSDCARQLPRADRI